MTYLDHDLMFFENEKCDACGKLGVWDFYGDYLCPECIKNVNETDEEMIEDV